MNIGEEEEAIEVPIPLAPGRQPVHEPSPQVEPVKEPAHALLGGKSLTEIQAEIMDRITQEYLNG